MLIVLASLAVGLSISLVVPLPLTVVRDRTLDRSQGRATELRYVAVGGGSAPDSTQLSLERNVKLAAEVLPGPGQLLFAGGTGSPTVQVHEPKLEVDPLVLALAELVDPRPGRDCRYQAVTVLARAASRVNVEQTLVDELNRSGQPLLLFIATHGEQGEAPELNSVALWGGGTITARDLALWQEASTSGRALRVVAASCYSGGLAELVFTGADESAGPTSESRCGLFASAADRESSGCTADPNLDTDDGYARQFLQALAGRDVAGIVLPATAIDFDLDGRISLLEAHTRARIAARSIDTPTTTSERWLTHVASEIETGPEAALPTPEEDAVIEQLGREMKLVDEPAVVAAFAAITTDLAALGLEVDEAASTLDELNSRLLHSLLERWPVLDDPWHPLFGPTISKDRDAITKFLDASKERRAVDKQRTTFARFEQRWIEAEVRQAMTSRLVQAYETRQLARRLRAAGGPNWEHYRKLLACERTPP